MNDVRIKDTFMTVILIGINVLLFIVPLIINGATGTERLLTAGAQYWPLITEGEWWRLITCNFIHFSSRHLMSNMLVLFAVGSIMEPCLGHVRYTVLYLFSGICGSVLSCFVNMLTRSYATAAGASASVYGLLGAMACIILFGHGKKIGINVSVRRLILFAALSVLANMFSRINIDHMGHLGGFLGGVTVFAVMSLAGHIRGKDPDSV